MASASASASSSSMDPGAKDSQEVATAADGTIDLFGHSGQAKLYRDFRPTYTPAVLESVLARVPAGTRSLYVDVACGSGQLTHLIAPYFQRAIGIDRSFEQLGQAGMNTDTSSVTFLPGSAFQLPLADHSVDLLTVAQGLHWLRPYESFFAEVRRVLKPETGVFVTVGYAFPQLVNTEANKKSMHFYINVLGADKSPGDQGCLWDTNRPTVDSYYADIPFPYSEADGLVCTLLTNRVTLTVERYINYLKTLSAYRTLLRLRSPSDTCDPLIDVESGILGIIGGTDAQLAEVEVDIPFFTISFQSVVGSP